MTKHSQRLAIITTHPIQYNAPLFRLLSQRKNIDLKVFYTWGQSKDEVYDAKFGIIRSWDIPLTEGYEHEFVDNSSKQPDSNRFWGIVNPGLQQKIKAWQPDAVLVYRWSVYSHFKIMQQLGGSPKLFFRGDSHLKNKKKGVSLFFQTMILKFIFRKVEKAFYVGEYNRRYFLKYGLKKQQLIAAPHAIDNSRFAFNALQWELQAEAERKKLEIPEEAIVFLYAGKFYELKQLDVLINVFKQVKNHLYRLLFVGSGEQELMLKELAKEDDRIVFQSFKNQSDMPWVYRMANVLVLPSKSETWGLAVNEAMACGRAAIVSDQCGCAPELIVQGQTGFVFKSGSEQELLFCLQQFADKQKAEEMGKSALKHIEQFSLERVAEVIEREVIA